MGKLTSLYDSNPSDYKLDWDQWRQSACWWMNSISRQSPNTQWLNRHCLKTRDEIFVALVLRDLSDLFKSMDYNGSLRLPFFFYPLTFLFFYPCTVFSCAPPQRTHTFVICFVCAHTVSARGVAVVSSPGLWLGWLLAVLNSCFLGLCALLCLQILSRCGTRILAVFPGVLQPNGGRSS